MWRKRRWVCPVPVCPTRSFVEQADRIARSRGPPTVGACRWAIGQLRREYASVAGLARRRRSRYELADARLGHAVKDLLGVVLAVDPACCAPDGECLG